MNIQTACPQPPEFRTGRFSGISDQNRGCVIIIGHERGQMFQLIQNQNKFLDVNGTLVAHLPGGPAKFLTQSKHR
jgi:hypothetical protein